MRKTVFLIVLFSLALVCQAEDRPGRFWLRVLSEKGKQIKPVNGIVPWKSSSRLRLVVCLRAANLSDGSESLDIRSLNQHPDYWEHRPPANVTLKVERLNGNSSAKQKTRVYSPGGGVNLHRHELYVDLDILEADPIRESKLREIAQWFYRAREKNPALPPIEQEPYLTGIISYLDESYIYIPPGRYRIVAHFRPNTRSIWPVDLDSEPLTIDVEQAGDSLEKLKKGLMENINK
ncbi:MAG TPA: hypothetical protein VGL29_22035 [Blastocatellia bacterium]|jgi:hypothetical protein